MKIIWKLTTCLILSCAVSSTHACINDREIEKADDDYRRDYQQPNAPTDEEAPMAMPVLPYAIAGMGATGLLLIGSGLVLNLRRNRQSKV